MESGCPHRRHRTDLRRRTRYLRRRRKRLDTDHPARLPREMEPLDGRDVANERQPHQTILGRSARKAARPATSPRVVRRIRRLGQARSFRPIMVRVTFGKRPPRDYHNDAEEHGNVTRSFQTPRRRCPSDPRAHHRQCREPFPPCYAPIDRALRQHKIRQAGIGRRTFARYRTLYGTAPRSTAYACKARRNCAA